MTTPHDPSARFDSIETDCSPAALSEAPGFYMLDDCGGRFVVDREMGVVSLADAALIARDAGQVHTVRLRVVESSGSDYELTMQLRITGLVPQMVGAEDDALFFASDIPDDMAANAFSDETPAFEIEAAPLQTPVQAEAPAAPWHEYAAARAALGKGDIVRPRRSLILRAFPEVNDLPPATLAIEEPLPAVGSSAPWSL